MSTQPFPTTPNLDHLKKQAKQLVKDNKEGQVDAFSSIKAPFPRLEQPGFATPGGCRVFPRRY